MADSLKGSSRGVESVAHGGKGENGVLANGSNGHADAEVLDLDPIETREWLDALDSVLQTSGEERGQFLLSQLKNKAVRGGVEIPFTANTPHINTIPLSRQSLFPGNRELERRIKSLIRWNAMAETTLPAFVLGGINLQTIDKAIAAGARRIAVSAAIARADDPRTVAAALLAALPDVV